MTAAPLSTPLGWTSPSGLRVELEAHGALRTLALGDVVVNLFVANALEGGPANLLLRRHDGAAVACTPLLGPRSPTRWRADASAGTLDGTGSWQGLDYRVGLRLAAGAPAWFWHVHVANTGAAPARIDLLAWQDLALADYGAIRLNEYYVSQYLDHAPLGHAAKGFVIASRQNQAVGKRHPWCAIGSLNRAVGYATDALQVHGLATRAGVVPPAANGELPSTRLQHEHAMAALQDAAVDLPPGGSTDLGFFGRLVADHPDATSGDDLARVDETLALPEATPPLAAGGRDGAGPEDDARLEARLDTHGAEAGRAADASAQNLFSTAPLFAVVDLDDEAELDRLFGAERRHVERDADGRLLGFFHGADAHVALRAKELRVLRPHGQVLRTGRLDVVDESALTSTAWMGGVFHSMLTQGHVSINRCLSTVRSYLSLFRSQGLRVFVEVDNAWKLLDQPSAFEMRPDACRWIYRHGAGRIDVTSRAHSDPHALGLDVEFVDGPARRCLVCLHVALDGDDGNTRGAVSTARDGRHLLVAPAPGTEMARRFPSGHLRIEPAADTTVEHVGGDETLFADGCARGLPYLTLRTAVARAARFRLVGRFVVDEPDVPASASGPAVARATHPSGAPPSADAATARPVPRPEASSADAVPRIDAPATSPLAAPLSTVTDLLPWLAQNALVHYLAPRGLEQFSGGGWGTRDVCQGPMEYLLALGRHDAIRDLLLRVMAAQRPDGDWPQWFMFFARDAAIRADDSHGDIVFWPLLALGQYLVASGDATILEARVPFYSARRTAASAGTGPTVWQHALRALALTRRRTVAGTALAAYGHGDWNDALQPADPSMREHMCSAWTVTLHHQALTTLAQGLRRVGRKPAAARLEHQAIAVRRDFLRLLLVDGVLAGYARFDGGHGAGSSIEYLLHPRDATTGVRYSVLAMIHAILEGLFDEAAMRAHLRLIDEHLTGPDGARLFDRPMAYRGGLQRHFQRAESASFFGREIGLMYTHAHLRYAQALAHVGDAERFFRALRQASPIGLRALVPSAAIRPSNAYYSSSDAAFADRYQASAEYGRVADGSIALEGGWRVYSSGAGILYGLVVRHLFGLRLEADALALDPVLPLALDGTTVRIVLKRREVEVVYQVAAPGYGVARVECDGRALPFVEEPNPYRRGAARVRFADLGLDAADDTGSAAPRRLVVTVGA